MNRDLFLAILAMDFYNKGNGQGIKNVKVEADVTKLGNAIIRTDSIIEIGAPAKAAGFYAIAYDVSQVGAGLSGTVVSYRGSDNFLGRTGFANFIRGNLFQGNDIRNGYGVSGGHSRTNGHGGVLTQNGHKPVASPVPPEGTGPASGEHPPLTATSPKSRISPHAAKVRISATTRPG